MLKRTLYLLTICCFIIPLAKAQAIRTLFYDEILYGKVKLVSQLLYSPGHAIPELTDTTWYDAKGNTLEDHRKTSHGTIFTERYLYSTSKPGKKIEIISNSSDQNIIGKLNEAGNLLAYDSYFKDGRVNFKSAYEYDKRNDLIKYQFWDKGTILTMTKTYKYDNEDRLVEQDFWKKDGTLDYIITFKYFDIDKAGNWLKRTSQKTSAPGLISESTRTERQIIYY